MTELPNSVPETVVWLILKYYLIRSNDLVLPSTDALSAVAVVYWVPPKVSGLDKCCDRLLSLISFAALLIERKSLIK